MAEEARNATTPRPDPVVWLVEACERVWEQQTQHVADVLTWMVHTPLQVNVDVDVGSSASAETPAPAPPALPWATTWVDQMHAERKQYAAPLPDITLLEEKWHQVEMDVAAAASEEQHEVAAGAPVASSASSASLASLASSPDTGTMHVVQHALTSWNQWLRAQAVRMEQWHQQTLACGRATVAALQWVLQSRQQLQAQFQSDLHQLQDAQRAALRRFERWHLERPQWWTQAWTRLREDVVAWILSLHDELPANLHPSPETLTYWKGDDAARMFHLADYLQRVATLLAWKPASPANPNPNLQQHVASPSDACDAAREAWLQAQRAHGEHSPESAAAQRAYEEALTAWHALPLHQTLPPAQKQQCYTHFLLHYVVTLGQLAEQLDHTKVQWETRRHAAVAWLTDAVGRSAAALLRDYLQHWEVYRKQWWWQAWWPAVQRLLAQSAAEWRDSAGSLSPAPSPTTAHVSVSRRHLLDAAANPQVAELLFHIDALAHDLVRWRETSLVAQTWADLLQQFGSLCAPPES